MLQWKRLYADLCRIQNHLRRTIIRLRRRIHTRLLIIPQRRIFMCKKIIISFQPRCYLITIHSTRKLSVVRNTQVFHSASFQPTVLYLVPTLAYFLTSHPSVNARHLNNVKISFFAGGSTPVSEMEKLVRTGGNKMKVRHGKYLNTFR